jgi:hypothetical protein
MGFCQIAKQAGLLLCLSSCGFTSYLPTESETLLSTRQMQALSAGLRPKTFTNGKSLSIRSEGQVLIPNVPFASQGADNTCGQAAMAMLLKYWGADIYYLKVAKEGNPLNIATSRESILNYLHEKGLAAKAQTGDIRRLLAELHQARPVIALLDYGGLTRQHYVVLVGYNPVTAEILIHDSLSDGYKPMPLKDFLKAWQNKPVVDLPIWGGPQYKNLMFSVHLPEEKP